jgi:nitrite reductase/ring-hydroxylating ferredoxin subunit
MTTNEKISLVQACTEAEVPHDGKIISKSVQGKSIALARYSESDERIVAFESVCPHYQAPLRFGHVVEGEVVCPWHFMRFDTVTGAAAACGKTIMHLRTYNVQVKDGQVYIDMPSDQAL